MMKEETKHKLLLIPVFILAAITMPLAAIVGPALQDDLLIAIGVIGSCIIALSYAAGFLIYCEVKGLH